MRFCSTHRQEYFADCGSCVAASVAERARRAEAYHAIQSACEQDRVAALDALRETCGMYCERLPDEVREALHAIPGIEKTHAH